jgi:hypothetical protein
MQHTPLIMARAKQCLLPLQPYEHHHHSEITRWISSRQHAYIILPRAALPAHHPPNILAYSIQLMALARPSAMPPPAVAPVIVCVVDSGRPAGGREQQVGQPQDGTSNQYVMMHGYLRLVMSRASNSAKHAVAGTVMPTWHACALQLFEAGLWAPCTASSSSCCSPKAEPTAMTNEVDSSIAKPRLGVMCVHCRGRGEGGGQDGQRRVRQNDWASRVPGIVASTDKQRVTM